MKRIISYFAAALLLFAASSCIDEKIYDDTVIGEGEATLSAEVLFKNFTPALDGSRAAGNVLNGIENLYLFVYNEGGTELLYSQVFEKDKGLTVIAGGNTGTTPSDGQYEPKADGAPLPTDRGEFDFTLPFGKYKIYAVANVRGEYASKLSPDKVGTDTKLKEVQFKWDANNIGNNDQMFGVFTTGALDKSPAETFNAPVITVNQTGITLRAWLTRLASKVTVAYNASGLNNGVWIYIKNVTVHDIAAECYLGQANDPQTADGVLNRRTGNANKPGVNYTPSTPNTRITYPGNPAANIYDKSQSGLELYNGLVTMDGDEMKPIILGSNHSAGADALFFYENMKGNKADDPRYDKRPQISGDDQVGENVREPINDNDYQDRVPYGTYIEVEAYYVSVNPQNPGSGPIKYRFMLGKNVTYDYNVQRNYHYKLTLGFNGWANQPDWHIDFDNTPPLLEVPTVYRVSYLYQQRSTLPIKVSKNCKNLRVDIIENNWAPSDPNDYSYPANPVQSEPAEYQFQWNKEAFNSFYSDIKTLTDDDGNTITYNAKMPYLGFLALNMPKANDVSEIPVTIPEKPASEWTSPGIPNYYSYRDGEKGQQALKDFYELSRGMGSQAYSEYNQAALSIGDEKVHASDCPLNAYSVVPLEDGTDSGDKIVMVNMWTRARTMIENAGFSGNNPYEYFVRKATLKVTATFDMGEQPDETRTEYLTVLQEPRIVNPKAVWRKSGSGAKPFHVLLMTTEGSNQKSNYTPLKSDGEWTASVEMGSNVTLSKSATTIGDEKDGVIYGKTGTEVDFNININGDGYAVVNVLYHNNNCTHKILVRQGYEQPTALGGKIWSNYTLQSATVVNGQPGVYDAVETASPFYLGSLYRRGRITKGILEINNSRTNENMGPLQSPSNHQYILSDGERLSWISLGCENNNTNPEPMGTFRINGQNWKVPELTDFNALKANCEFALGVIYGEATETSRSFEVATGYSIERPDNTDYGVRGVIAYDAKGGTAAQVLFSLGKDGYGRRKNAGTTDPSNNNPKRGMLIYSDVDFLLSIPAAAANVFRPVPYNLKIVPGAIFWLNHRVADGYLGTVTPGPTMSWDVNYFNYDFNSFDNSGDSNYRDANVIKLVKAD